MSGFQAAIRAIASEADMPSYEHNSLKASAILVS